MTLNLLVAVAVLVGAVAAIQTARLHISQKLVAELRLAHAEEVLRAERATQEWERRERALEQTFALQAANLRREAALANSRADSIAATARSSNERLRRQIAEYAERAANACGSSGTGSYSEIVSLGTGLERALQAEIDLTARLEQCNTDAGILYRQIKGLSDERAAQQSSDQ